MPETIHITVGGMTCAACQSHVQHALEEQPGVQKAAVNLMTEEATVAQEELDVAMDANPIGLIVLAIGALVTAVILIATKTTWFQTIWKYAWQGIKDAAAAVWDFLKTASRH